MKKTRIFTLIVLTILFLPTVTQLYLAPAHGIMRQPASNYSFGASQAVEHVPGVDVQPSALQLSNSTIWLAWQSNRAGSNDIYLKTLNVTATPPSWTSSVRITTSGSNAYPSLSQFPNGTIILTWTSNPTGYDNLYFMTYANGRWSSRVQLTSGAFYDEAARTLITTDGTLWVTWERDTPTGLSHPAFYHQIYSKSMSRAGSWTPDTAITTNLSVDSFTPSIAVSKHDLLWFAWARNSTSFTNIVYRTLNGTSWSSDTVLTSAAVDSSPYMMQDRNGTIWLYWSRQANLSGSTAYQLFDKFSSNAGQTWSADNQLTSGGTSADPVFDREPSTIQGYDLRIWLFYASNQYNLDYDLYYMNSGNVFPVHDIAVTNIQVTPTSAYPWGDAPQNKVTINVTIANLGDYDESTIAVTIQAINKTSITVGTVLMQIMLSGTTSNALITWDTLATHASAGRYTVVASIPRILTPGSPETIGNAVDNKLTSKYAEMVLLPGNLKKDGCITIIDAGMMGRAFGTVPASPNWNPDADLDNNGIITIIDFGILAAKFGKCV